MTAWLCGCPQRVVAARLGLRVSRLGPGAMSDAFDVAEWLGGEVEDPRTKAPHGLPEKLKVILEDGFNDDVFSEDDVTALATSTFDKMAEGQITGDAMTHSPRTHDEERGRCRRECGGRRR